MRNGKKSILIPYFLILIMLRGMGSFRGSLPSGPIRNEVLVLITGK